LTILAYVFFFSSRRRHTRSKRDWSSDVCSSDLVPELARGLAAQSPRILSRAVVAGMCATGFLLALVPFAALGVMGSDGITEVVTIAWGGELGDAADYLANLFALLAVLTCFCALGLTLL